VLVGRRKNQEVTPFGNWLTGEEARTLWQLPNAHTLKGKRERAIVVCCLAVNCVVGELFDLTSEHVQREDHLAIVDLIRKQGMYEQFQFLIGLNRLWTLALIRPKSETENCYASSKAILANFFSVGAYVSSRLYWVIDSIDYLPFCFRFPYRGQPNNNLLKFRLQRRLSSQILCFGDATSSHLCRLSD
jgi:hypothetical protein